MMRKRQTELTATAASIATAAAAAAAAAATRIPSVRSAGPMIPATSPCNAATPPSAERRRQSGSVRGSAGWRLRRRPRAAGPPRSAARTTTGVEAVYQLRGPSWTDDALSRSPAMASSAQVRDRDRRSRGETSPKASQRGSVPSAAASGIPIATSVPRDGSATPLAVEGAWGAVLPDCGRARRFRRWLLGSHGKRWNRGSNPHFEYPPEGGCHSGFFRARF